MCFAKNGGLFLREKGEWILGYKEQPLSQLGGGRKTLLYYMLLTPPRENLPNLEIGLDLASWPGDSGTSHMLWLLGLLWCGAVLEWGGSEPGV